MHCAVPLLSSKPPGHQLSSCLRQNSSCAALCPQHYVRRVAGRIFSDAFQSSCNIITLCCSRCLRGSHQSVTAALLKKPMASAWGWCCLHMGMGGQGDPCHLYRVPMWPGLSQYVWASPWVWWHRYVYVPAYAHHWFRGLTLGVAPCATVSP